MYSFLKNYLSKSYFPIIILLCIGFAVYLNSFGNTMFWDDDDFILKNVYVHDWQYVPKMFTENVIAGNGLVSNYYRPILLLVFALEWHIWENWAIGFHFINTLIHSLDGVLLFIIFRKLTKHPVFSFVIATLFLVHPLQTEAVVYVNSLGDSLSACFMFLGIYVSLKESKNKIKQWGIIFTCYISAILSKEIAIIMPLLLFAIHFYKNTDINSFWKRFQKTFVFVVPLFLVTGVYIYLRATLLNFQNSFNLYNSSNEFTNDIFIRIYTFGKIFLSYISLIIAPIHLHMERTVDFEKSIINPVVFIGLFLLLALISISFYTWKKIPGVTLGLWWFFAALIPTSNIVIPINGLMYEHWLYVPLIGFYFALGSFCLYFLQKFNTSFLKDSLTIFVILYIGILGILTIQRNNIWTDPITFYNDVLKYTTTSYRIYNNLGMAYADKQDFTNAITNYNKAIELDTENPVGYHNLANAYKAQNNTKKAVENYNKAIALNANFYYSYNALADLYLKQNDTKDALLTLERYTSIDKTPQTYILMAQIAYNEKDIQAALNYINKALEIDPTNQNLQQAKMTLIQQSSVPK